jgi:hypothetical protein
LVPFAGHLIHEPAPEVVDASNKEDALAVNAPVFPADPRLHERRQLACYRPTLGVALKVCPEGLLVGVGRLLMAGAAAMP